MQRGVIPSAVLLTRTLFYRHLLLSREVIDNQQGKDAGNSQGNSPLIHKLRHVAEDNSYHAEIGIGEGGIGEANRPPLTAGRITEHACSSATEKVRQDSRRP